MSALWQSISSWDVAAWGTWTLTIVLLIAGLAGTVVPLLPGPVLIFVAGLVHTLLLPEQGMSWWGLTILGLLVGVAYLVDFLSGALGSKWFGGSKWGIWGVLLGGLVGLFFGLPGLILGPLIGGFVFEIMFARKKIMPATKSTIGTAVGTGVGMVAKVALGVAMIVWFFYDALWL